MISSPDVMQENEQKQQAANANVFDDAPAQEFEQGSESGLDRAPDSQRQEGEETPLAMQNDFYTDELALQAADQGTETIAESVQDSKGPEVSVFEPFRENLTFQSHFTHLL